MNFLNKKIMPRYFLVTLVICLIGISILAKAIYTMTVERERWMTMSRLQVKVDRPLPAKRGNILSADGQVLAASLPQYKMFVDYMSCERDSLQRVKDQQRRDSILYHRIDTICQEMQRIFPDIIPAKLRDHLLKGRKQKSRYWPVYVDGVTTLKLKKKENRQITYVEYSKVKKLPLFELNSSVNYEKIDMRKRPFGKLALRTIGEFKDTARFGLELSFDSILAGKPGKFHFEKVRNRRVPVIDVPAEDGYDIQTTIDVGMQEICEKALGEKLAEINAMQGVCILMEVATGDIKAMTSLMRSNNGIYYEDHAAALTDLYEPGSVFKPQSFLVAFDDGLLGMTDQVNTGGGIYEFGSRKMRDHNWRSGGYGTLTVPQIIGNSSNVGVSVLIDKFYKDNPAKFVEGLHRIGSAEDLKIPIKGYMRPRIRRPGEGTYWSRTTLPWMSIGYETQVAPINTLNFYNAIANNGKMLRPRLVKAVLRAGQVIKEYPIEVLRQQMAKPEAVQNVRACLEYVTTRGVGKAAGSKFFSTAGKTGTAQIWTGGGRTSEYFITFAGYFPADKPLYSCIVCIRKPAPASGGGMCGPVFKRVAESVMAQRHEADYSKARDTVNVSVPTECKGDIAVAGRLFKRYGIPSNIPAMPLGQNLWGTADGQDGKMQLSATNWAEDIMPDVRGYGLRDAIYRLENIGLKVHTQGAGKVCEQSIPPGKRIKKGILVKLQLSYRKSHTGSHKSSPTTALKPEDKELSDQEKNNSDKRKKTKDNPTPKAQKKEENKAKKKIP